MPLKRKDVLKKREHLFNKAERGRSNALNLEKGDGWLREITGLPGIEDYIARSWSSKSLGCPSHALQSSFQHFQYSQGTLWYKKHLHTHQVCISSHQP
jgi:hypothetical protein